MSISQNIKQRVSNPLLDSKAVPESVIKELLDVAVCTPVHYNTDPWRFLVLQGDSRVKFGEFLAEQAKFKFLDEEESVRIAKLKRIKNKPLRAPVIIVAGAAKSDNAKAMMKEDLASVAVACQNILLAAEDYNLSAIWRTGAITYDQKVINYLGFDADTELVGFIYLGYPAKRIKAKSRVNSDSFTRWNS